MITQVPREDINYVWEQVEPLIERAFNYLLVGKTTKWNVQLLQR